MKHIISVIILLCMTISLCACGSADTSVGVIGGADGPTEILVTESQPAPENTPEPEKVAANVMVLNGTTGFGMAKLISESAAGSTALDYTFSVESDASAVTAALISGNCDIAALPTNAAATVYSKTGGGVQIAAINTLGVLYIVTDTSTMTIESLDDLAGMTVYAPAQNPTFLLKAILDGAGVEDVTIDNTYAQPADLRTAVVAGEVDIAVLPEPMVTIACSANEALSPVIDLTAEWDKVHPAGSLVQGCVVLRTEFAENNPEAVKAFLEEYEDSIAYLSEDVAAAGTLIEETGVFAKGAVAAKAIPNCNICFMAGEEMKEAMSRFCGILFEIEPSAIGGSVPGDDFYFIS